MQLETGSGPCPGSEGANLGSVMSISRSIATGISAALLATTGLVAAGAGIGVTAAVAAPSASKHCPSTKGKYPPGKCTIRFNHHTYKHHATVKYVTGQVFKPGEHITVTMVCSGPPRVVKHGVSRQAHSGGAAHATIIVPKSAHGTCKITLKGRHSGVQLSGSVHVNK
jgi:hypothetical protein